MSQSAEVLSGFVNVYKPKGMTSHDVISRLRRITHIKQIGHTGTLDPFAVGVLPVGIGKVTKLFEYLDDDKEYLATVQFGKNTSTYDIEGEVTDTFDKKVTRSEVEVILKSFEGEISQLPPIYSAIKVNGKKLYEYAREGKEVKIEPRKIFISKIELAEFDEEKQSAKILIGCSKGTYIRSIAYDLGKLLGCGGYLTALERTKAGRFLIENSVKLENLTDIDVIRDNLISPLEVLGNPVYQLNEEERIRVSHGNFLYNKNFNDEDIVFLIYSGKIFAVGKVEQNKILAKKVFEVL